MEKDEVIHFLRVRAWRESDDFDPVLDFDLPNIDVTQEECRIFEDKLKDALEYAFNEKMYLGLGG